MCRLIAWIKSEGYDPSLSREKKDLLLGLFLAQVHANKDGTGICLVKDGRISKFFKTEKDALSLLFQQRKKLESLLKEDSDFLIGHIRKSTTPKISELTAHPFVIDVDGKKLIGAHNGSFDPYVLVEKISQYEVDEPFKKREIKYRTVSYPVIDFLSDSRAFFKVLAEKVRREGDFVGALASLLREFDATSSFALTIYYDDRLWLVRNDSRPLWTFDARSERLGRFVATSREMFERALELTGLQGGERILKRSSTFLLRPMVIYSVDREGKIQRAKEIYQRRLFFSRISEKKRVRKNLL